MKINFLRLVAIVIIIVLSNNIVLAQKSKSEKTQLDAAFIASTYTITAGECVNFTDMSTGNPTGWQWSFPGSQTPNSTIQHPQNICYYYAGTYDVILEVQNSTAVNTEVIAGCITVEPNTTTPIADFDADYTTIPQGGTVTFTDLSQNGPFVSYAWTFNGGIPNVSNEEEPVPVAYTEVGTYSVELRVEDENSVQDNELKINYITVIPAATVPPVADFMADRVFIAPGDYINFHDMTSGSPYIWRWYFEGASPNTSNQQNPTSILYAMPGTYNVQLIVESNMGIDTITKEDYIIVSATDPCTAMPIADFKASQRLIRSGTRIYFEDKSLNNPTTWNWYFQGGYPTYSAVSNVINGIEYNAAGFWDVSLAVNNACGTDYMYREDYILVFSGPVNKYCDTITNVGSNENIYSPYLTGSWGYIGGHNGQKIKTYADYFNQYSFTQIEALVVPVVHCEYGEYNSYVTFYIWDGNTTYPETILAQKKLLLRNIPENFNNVVVFDTPVEVEGPFFAGYKINYVDNNSDGISEDKFTVSIVENRSYPSAVNTMYVEANSVWSTATAKFGIKTSSAIKPVTCIVDIDEFKITNDIDIYPNPASDYIYIQTGKLETGKDIEVKLIDITGREIISEEYQVGYNDIRINVNNLPQGLYLVTLRTDNNRITQRIMISK
ncbi:MAG TPA: PKD domain-containing protein [Bacteroidales bacterium]|nr:PKD domain-containing protein [Bacteroidales bacterium]